MSDKTFSCLCVSLVTMERTRRSILFFGCPEPETDEKIAADGMVAVIRLYRVRQRVCSEVHTGPGLDRPEKGDVPRVAERISSDAERAAVQHVEMLLQLQIVGEQVILVHQLQAPGDEIPASNRQDGFRQVRVHVALCRRAVNAAP